MSDDFFKQYFSVKTLGDRFSYFTEKCRDKKVLHIGCTDYPLEITPHSLHVRLSHIAKELHGMDIDEVGIEKYELLIPGRYYTSLKTIIDSNEIYDIIIAPETIEHIDNVSNFLKELGQIPAKEIVITAPSATKTQSKGGFKFVSGDTWFEEIHPDHNCWYSPYTLKNVILKYTAGAIVNEIFFLHDQHQVGVSFKVVRDTDHGNTSLL